jgi:hypothetical protein
MHRHNAEIDAVVTWVDGTDAKHRADFLRAAGDKKNLTLKNLPSGQSQARYFDNNEIEYCVKGIRSYMPWIRHIFLVTARQTPRFLETGMDEKLGVNIIDHEVIFREYEWALPTFNSRSIETVLHRIPGIADRYIYFNDDFIPINRSHPSDFYDGDRVVIRGHWERLEHYGPISTIGAAAALQVLDRISKKERSAHLLAQMRAARMAGFTHKYFSAAHAPHPIHTDTLKAFFSKNEDILIENIRHKFRSIDQFVTHPLAHHLEAAKDNVVTHDELDHLTLDFGKKDDVLQKLSLLQSPNIKFLCLQSLQLAKRDVKTRVLDFLDGMA